MNRIAYIRLAVIAFLVVAATTAFALSTKMMDARAFREPAAALAVETNVAAPPAPPSAPSLATSASTSEETLRAYTMTSTQTFTQRGDESSIEQATIVKYQRADGSYASVITRLAAKDTGEGSAQERTKEVVTRLGVPGQGVFVVDEKGKRLQLVSPLVDEKIDDVEKLLRDDPNFAKEDTVLGYRTLVLRQPNNSSVKYTEWHYAPQLRGAILKTVVVTPIGMQTTEATEIKTGEPDQTSFGVLLTHTVDSTHYEKQIAVLEAKGDDDIARGMREDIRQAKDPKPKPEN